jgi:hypothetical protein
MTNDIVQRLRARVYREVRLPGLAETYPVNPDGAEAADLIEAQAAEIERLKAERAGAWVSKCFICDDVDAPRERCLCVACHVGRERKRAEAAEAEVRLLRQTGDEVLRLREALNQLLTFG